MNNSPLVSVIIIFLNEERFIKEAIKSVIDQSYNNWELLLVDDGSVDSSIEIAKNYCECYPEKIYYLEHENHQNLGMSASRNLGISRAKGQFIAFLDADDVWLTEKLQRQIEIMNTNPEAGMVYGRTLIWNSWKHDQIGNDYFLDLGVKSNTLVHPPILFYTLLQNKSQTPTTCSILLRREIFDKIGLFEESFRGMYEDQVFFSKVHLNVPVYVSDESWAKYRQHSESCNIKSESNEDYCTERIPFLNWLSLYLEEKGFNKNLQIKKAFQKELSTCMHPGLFKFKSRYSFLKNKLRTVINLLPRNSSC